MTSLGESSLGNTSMDPMSPLLAATVPAPDDSQNDGFIPGGYGHTPSRSPLLSSTISGYSPATPDVTAMRNEIRNLKTKLRQSHQDLQSEQDSVSNMRRKLNTMERERLDSVSKANEEVSRLDGEVARLRSQMEKGEAVRQNLEFELAKAHKETGHEKRSATEREQILADVNESMKQKISELSHQVEQLCQELETVKVNAQEDASKLQSTNDEKDRMLSALRTDQDLLEAEKDKLENALQQQENTVTDLEERVRELEEEKRSLGDNVRRQVTEIDIMKEKDQRLKKDFEVALERMKTLEESIEAERAAHLESKFNSEIVQLRVRDLEGALEMEKTSKTESVTTIEKLNNQLRDMQQIYDEEKRSSAESRDRLEKAEKEYALLSKELQNELDDKKSLIRKLSSQLELHQKNFNELKDELSKAKKRQVYLEETYGGSIRELELLLNTFQMDANGEVKKKPPKKKESKPAAPTVVLEGIRHTLIDYKHKLDDATTELSQIKAIHARLSKECTSYKDTVVTKDKALQNAQQTATKTSKELRKVRSETSELERQVAALKGDMKGICQNLEKERKDHRQLQEQMVKVASQYKMDEKSKLSFLHSLYQQLLTGHSLAKPPDGSMLANFTWPELTILINEQAALVVNSLRRAEEKVVHLESVLQTKDTMLDGMQKAHDHQLHKLASVTEDRHQTWHQQKAEMEEHYSQLLAEIHARHKKTQTLADQAWEKLRVNNNIHQGLETECSQLRHQVSHLQNENQTLLTTCALLCGAIYPLHQRASMLVSQRQLLQEQLNKFDSFKLQVQVLVDALSVDHENSKSDSPQKRKISTKRSPLLTFRIGVISVIAANRLIHMSRGSCRLFTTQDITPGMYSTVVYSGGVQPDYTDFTGVSSEWSLGADKHTKQGEDAGLDWMTSPDLLSVILSSMTDIHTAIQKVKQQDSPYDPHSLANAARSSFSKLMCQLPSMFAANPPAETITTGKPSLMRFLLHGLNRILAHTSLEGRPLPFSPAHTIASSLQEHVLEFTRRQHTAEVERRDLRMELSRMSQERYAWSKDSHDKHHLQLEITKLQNLIEHTVPRERFDGVCRELDSALKREHQAQELLSEQTNSLDHMGQQLNAQLTEDGRKEHTLGEAVQGLSEAKLELRRQEQMARQFNRQVQALETEKKSLLRNVQDAERALKTAAKDKDVLSTYMMNIENALQKLKANNIGSGMIGPVDLSLLATPDLIPQDQGRAGPELVKCQILVSSFIEAQQTVNARIRTLQDEIDSHKQHINSLKRELKAACKRQIDEPMELPYGEFKEGYEEDPNSYNPKLLVSSGPVRMKETFEPLVEDRNDSYGMPTPVSGKTKMSRAPPKAVKSPAYKTPKTSHRMNVRRSQADGAKNNK